jgi:hypothetical protein
VREVRGECERCEVSGERERCDVRASRREASARALTVHTGRDGSRSPIRGILEVVRIGGGIYYSLCYTGKPLR